MKQPLVLPAPCLPPSLPRRGATLASLHRDLTSGGRGIPLSPILTCLPTKGPSSSASHKSPSAPTSFPEPGLASSPSGRAQLSSCSEPQVSQFIRKHVASSLLVSDTSTELSYILPSEAVKKGAFERLFQV